MATPTRSDTMIKNLMKLRKNKIKEIKKEEEKQKDPEDVKKLIELWERIKKKK